MLLSSPGIMQSLTQIQGMDWYFRGMDWLAGVVWFVGG